MLLVHFKCDRLTSRPSTDTDLLKKDTLKLCFFDLLYRGADKALSRPGRKQARKRVRGRARFQQHRDSSCHQVFFPANQGAEGNSRYSDRNISL